MVARAVAGAWSTYGRGGLQRVGTLSILVLHAVARITPHRTRGAGGRFARVALRSRHHGARFCDAQSVCCARTETQRRAVHAVDHEPACVRYALSSWS
jgi:hypothetical protein